jgi:hypothetical protein
VIADLTAEFSEVTKEGTAILKEFAPVIRVLGNILILIPQTELQLLAAILRKLHAFLPGGGNEPKAGELNKMMEELFASIDEMEPTVALPIMAPPMFGPMNPGF